MLTVSNDFSSQEQNEIFRITKPDEADVFTMDALYEYIKTIKNESSKPSEEDIKNASVDEFKEMMKKQKEKRK